MFGVTSVQEVEGGGGDTCTVVPVHLKSKRKKSVYYIPNTKEQENMVWIAPDDTEVKDPNKFILANNRVNNVEEDLEKFVRGNYLN